MLRSCNGIDYQLTRRPRQRSIRISVVHNEVRVSTSMSCPQAQIDEFVTAKTAWIKAKLAGPETPRADFQWRNNAPVYVTGRLYRLTLINADQGQVMLSGDNLVICGAGLKEWQKQWQLYCRQQLSRLIAGYQSLLPADVGFYTLHFRDMTSRWGSCVYDKKKITISTRCLSLPEPAIRYVFVHELAHLSQPNHQKAFYSRVGQLWPDYQTGMQACRQFNM